MTKHLLLTAVVLALAISWGAFALDVPLTYQKASPETQEIGFSGGASPDLLLKCPPGDWKLPELTGENPIYVLIELGDSKRLLIFDRGKATDSFYNRLHFDANGNKDLTDDPVLKGEGEGNQDYDRVQFGPIETAIEVQGKSLPYSFITGANCWNKAQLKTAKLTPQNARQFLQIWLNGRCLYQGEFALDSGRYRVVLIDGNCNGRFDDKLSSEVTGPQGEIYPSGDRLYLRPVGEQFRYDDAFILGDLLLINGKLFDVRVSIPEGKMTLTPDTEKVARIKLAMDAERITLDTKAGKRSVMMFRPGKQVELPEAEYRVFSYAVLRKDEKGSQWLVSGQASGGSPFAPAGAALTFGEPYTVWADVPEWSVQNFSHGAPEVQLLLNIQGVGKERVTNLERISGEASSIPLAQSNVNRPKEATYRIATSEGEVVAQGNFQYG